MFKDMQLFALDVQFHSVNVFVLFENIRNAYCRSDYPAPTTCGSDSMSGVISRLVM